MAQTTEAQMPSEREIELEPYYQTCNYCGGQYDDTQEGHQHDESCECGYCEASDVRVMGYGFCSPECEMHFVREELHTTTKRQYSTRLEEE